MLQAPRVKHAGIGIPLRRCFDHALVECRSRKAGRTRGCGQPSAGCAVPNAEHDPAFSWSSPRQPDNRSWRTLQNGPPLSSCLERAPPRREPALEGWRGWHLREWRASGSHRCARSSRAFLPCRCWKAATRAASSPSTRCAASRTTSPTTEGARLLGMRARRGMRNLTATAPQVADAERRSLHFPVRRCALPARHARHVARHRCERKEAGAEHGGGARITSELGSYGWRGARSRTGATCAADVCFLERARAGPGRAAVVWRSKPHSFPAGVWNSACVSRRWPLEEVADVRGNRV
jgi:hypothetical protein